MSNHELSDLCVGLGPAILRSLAEAVEAFNKADLRYQFKREGMHLMSEDYTLAELETERDAADRALLSECGQAIEKAELSEEA